MCTCFQWVFFFAYSPIEYKYFLNRSIWPLDNTQTGINTPGQSGPWSNGDEWVLHTPQISRTGDTIRCGLLSYTGHLFLRVGSLLSLRVYSQRILSPVESACISVRYMYILKGTTNHTVMIGSRKSYSYIYIYIYIYIIKSHCLHGFLDSLSLYLSLPMREREREKKSERKRSYPSQQVLQTTSCVRTEML